MMSEAQEHDTKLADFQREALPYLDAVYRFALRLTGSEDRAHDLTQDTFLRAYKAWDTYTPGTRCKSWLFTITRNLFLRQRDRQARHDEIVAEQSIGGAPGVDPVNPMWASVTETDPEGEFFHAIVDDVVLDAIRALPEEYRTAVVLSDVDGLSYQEMADLLGVPIGTVKSRLFRGRRQLQEALYDYAVEMQYVRPAAGGDE